MSKTFTLTQVASHNTTSDLWIILNGEVYDVTEFQKGHPGGEKALGKMGGKDATKVFKKKHNEGILKSEKYKSLRIGKVKQRGEGMEEKKESALRKLFRRKDDGFRDAETKLERIDSKIDLHTEARALEKVIKSTTLSMAGSVEMHEAELGPESKVNMKAAKHQDFVF